MFSVLVDSVCTNSCGCCSTQLIETVSAVDKDEMVHRQYFHFSIAPEAVNNHNFSLKDNRGGWLKHSISSEKSDFCLDTFTVFIVASRHSSTPASEIEHTTGSFSFFTSTQVSLHPDGLCTVYASEVIQQIFVD